MFCKGALKFRIRRLVIEPGARRSVSVRCEPDSRDPRPVNS